MIWKQVPEFPDYEVSEHGDLRRGTKHLKPERVKGSGRKRYCVSRNGCSYKIPAAHLVAFAFIGPSPFDGAELCHRDGFFHHNHFSNLRWDTHAGNVADTAMHRLRHRESLGRASSRDRLAAAASELLR